MISITICLLPIVTRLMRVDCTGRYRLVRNRWTNDGTELAVDVISNTICLLPIVTRLMRVDCTGRYRLVHNRWTNDGTELAVVM